MSISNLFIGCLSLFKTECRNVGEFYDLNVGFIDFYCCNTFLCLNLQNIFEFVILNGTNRFMLDISLFNNIPFL